MASHNMLYPLRSFPPLSTGKIILSWTTKQALIENSDVRVAELGHVRAYSLGGKEVAKVTDAVSDDGCGIRAFACGGGTKLIPLKQTPRIGAKFWRSKRSMFTKLIFWAKIDMILGG